MYILGVNPIKSKHWQPPEGEDLSSLDNTYLTPGARDARVRGRRVAIFSKLPGRDSRVVIELLDATTFTVHAKVAGSVDFLAYIGVVSLPVIPCTRLSAGEFSLGH